MLYYELLLLESERDFFSFCIFGILQQFPDEMCTLGIQPANDIYCSPEVV